MYSHQCTLLGRDVKDDIGETFGQDTGQVGVVSDESCCNAGPFEELLSACLLASRLTVRET